jgi:homospermidine synthase
MKHVAFGGRLVMLGFGSIGQGVLPLILRHIDMPRERITILSGDARGQEIAAAYGVSFAVSPLTRDNFRDVLTPLLKSGDCLLNVSVDVSSVALIAFARTQGALYLDTCIEPWPGGYTDPSLTPSQRSNHALRESALALATAAGPTAVLTHGANPGLVSHFVKRALLNIARDTGVDTDVPATRAGWAALSRDLGVKVIHIAERDTQTASIPKQPREFVNTWSIDGFAGEGCQPSELGWGTHEKVMPADGRRHEFGSDAAIYLLRPGASTRVRTWTPLAGPLHGFLITHNESISIADYYSVVEGGAVQYRPTVHYAYLRRRGAVGARDGGAQLAAAAEAASDDAGDHFRHRRAGRAADGP